MKIQFSEYLEKKIATSEVTYDYNEKTNLFSFTCLKCKSKWVPLIQKKGRFKMRFYKCTECIS
jgi:DNA-directed RNA polymerase subunit M/transcription elongation factor TFIIS